MIRVRLDQFTPTGGQSMEFCDPERAVVAYQIGDVLDVVRKAEAATREGLWSVGFVAYEAAPAFDATLTVRAREEGRP